MESVSSALNYNFHLIHARPVTSLISTKSGLCLSGNEDNSVNLYDYYNGLLIKRWRKHLSSITRVAYGQRDELCASGSRDKKVFVWTESTDDNEMKLESHTLPVTGLDFSPDCKKLCTGSRDNSIKMWDLTRGHQIREEIISRNLVTHLKWSKTSDILAQTSEDKQLRVWDTRTLQVVHTFAKQQYIQLYCDISSDDNYILTCTGGSNGNGCDIQLWDMRLCEQIKCYRGHVHSVTGCIFLSPLLTSGNSREQIASISQDETIRIWDQEISESIAVQKIPTAGTLTDIQDFGDGSLGIATQNLGIRRYLRGTKHTGQIFLKHVSTF